MYFIIKHNFQRHFSNFVGWTIQNVTNALKNQSKASSHRFVKNTRNTTLSPLNPLILIRCSWTTRTRISFLEISIWGRSGSIVSVISRFSTLNQTSPTTKWSFEQTCTFRKSTSLPCTNQTSPLDSCRYSPKANSISQWMKLRQKFSSKGHWKMLTVKGTWTCTSLIWSRTQKIWSLQ